MHKCIERNSILISIVLITVASVASFFFSIPINTIFCLATINLSIVFTAQKHWKSYQQAECTREKMFHNLSFDIIGLLLTMGAAMYVGRLAGGYLGIRARFWVGLLAGFLGGFLAAWVVRSVWGRLVKAAAR